MKQQLQHIAETSTGHSFHRRIKADPALLAWVMEHTQHLDTASISERGYYLVHGRPECAHGNQRKFLTFTRGYGYCARPEHCVCHQQDVGNHSRLRWQQKTPEQMAQTQQRREHTNLQRYGVTNTGQTPQAKQSRAATYEDPQRVQQIGERIRETKRAKYGDPNWVNSEQRRRTCQERYGVDEHLQRPEVWKQIQETNTARYGVPWVSQNSEIKQKQKNTRLERYGGVHPSQRHISEEVRDKLNNKKWLQEQHQDQQKPFSHIAQELGVSCALVGNKAREHGIKVCFGNSSVSLGEQALVDWLSSVYKQEIVTASRNIIAPRELDIYLPDRQLAIEFNGTYWHSEVAGNKHRNYHLEKTLACEAQGIRLIHVWEHDWQAHPEIVCSRISHQLGLSSQQIPARSCQIQEVTKVEKKQFLTENHLQGTAGSSIDLGLFYQGNLVALMTFSKSRFSGDVDYEMVRFCTKNNVNVVGAAGKLFSKFVRDYQPHSVVTYADRQWGNGDFYANLGFQFQHYSAPGYQYTQDYSSVVSRHKLQKHRQHLVLPQFDQSLSEWKNAQANGYDRIWDCGHAVYVFRSSDK